MIRPRVTEDESITMQSIHDRVIAIIAEQAILDVADISADSTLQSLGIDSLGLVEAIFAIEEAFDISVPFNANNSTENGFDTASLLAIIATVEELIAQKST